MEKKFLSGLSLFDFLAMVIPGGLFLAIFGNWTGYVPFVIDETQGNKFFVYTIILVASYLIGIVYNALMEQVTELLGCRNNPKRISLALRKVITNTSKQYWTTLYLLIPYCRCKDRCIIQEIYQCILQIIYKSWQIVKCLFCHSSFPKDPHNYVKNKYYEAYYYVATHPINSSISVMESQVAFMRNMFIPVLIITTCLKSYFPEFGDNCCIKFICIAFCITLPIATCCRQNKIYERVWEDYIYLKYLEQENIKRNKL